MKQKLYLFQIMIMSIEYSYLIESKSRIDCYYLYLFAMVMCIKHVELWTPIGEV